MSWMKKRSTVASNPNATAAPVPMFNPNQHSNQDNQWQQDNTTSGWYNQPGYNQQPQQNYWQQQQQQPYNVQNNLQTQPAPDQYQQNTYSPHDPQKNQGYYQTNYTQQTYGNTQYNQTVHQQQQQQQHYGYNETQNNTYGQQVQATEADSWNWGWGDEDNSNMLSSQTQNVAEVKPIQNNITDSFTNNESWNWTVDNTTTQTSEIKPVNSEIDPADTETAFPKMGKLADKHRKPSKPDLESLKSDSLYEPQPTVDFLQPNMMGKRNKSDNLTPQWSIESQMSQDSSDDIAHTSESDKSRMISRSSTISQSPISAQDANIETLSTIPLQEQAVNSQDVSAVEGNYNSTHLNTNLENIESPFTGPPLKKNITPPPPAKNATPPLMSPPPSRSADDSKNPYKRAPGVNSHKIANKTRSQDNFFNPPAPVPAQMGGYPTQQNFASQGGHFASYNQPSFADSYNQSVNLESPPDNSEQPDTMPTQQHLRKLSQGKSLPYMENQEVAPINDRNQYLETGQLSDDNNLQVDALPPPGLSRMVLGQMEHGDSDTNPQPGSEEPPPGLSRMVLGQTESASSLTNNQSGTYDASGPPVGFPRMVPGESSSPETTTNNRHQYSSMAFQDHNSERKDEDYLSETEFNQIPNSRITPQPRSATIGADTPPTVSNIGMNAGNRSETIGANSSPHDDSRATNPTSSENRIGAIGIDTNSRDMNLTGASVDQVKNDRRESIEGQTQDTDISGIVASVRDLTVGENPTDGQTSIASTSDQTKRHSRQESSDSDHDERAISPKDRRDRRSKDKDDRRDKERSRYSSDAYRDKRYDRRRHRDKYYDDDTDYLSDRDRRDLDRSERREDYDRKYSSLRKDKDREKKRRGDPRDRDYGRETRRDYYSRYDDRYEEESRSRPTSRSDSLHDSYRERGHERERRHRDRDRERDHRGRHMGNPYQSYMQGYGYDPYNQYYQQYQYQYYENLRRTNPQAYAEWYRKYYQQAGQAVPGFGPEDRGSVHSGRSSVNDELTKDRYTRQSYYSQASIPNMSAYYREPNSISNFGMDDTRPFDHTDSSLNLEDNTLASQRMTPAKFATAHAKSSIISGKFVKVLPHYPLDGQSATVQISLLHDILINDDELPELMAFPGPLVKGVTHKKTIIEYCENKIKNARNNCEINDSESYILIWELLILLLRQNGVVVGTDIAELLMKGHKSNEIYKEDSSDELKENLQDPSNETIPNEMLSGSHSMKEEYVTNKFREYLIYGSEKEALEWAMKHGLWGHALFLASKLDKRTYANVMTRFANGLTINDPLQTLYQLLSGRVPAAVTCVADEKWGDWRPHLAMILSNTTQHPDLDLKAITTLGDTLMNRGSLYAAQFCYIMAQVNFSRYGTEDAKLVLLGSNHNKEFNQFATNEAIHMTEVYEYARTLNDTTFVLPEFQAYKYLVATRLADRGLLEKALSYLERVSMSIIQNPTLAQPSLVNRIYTLADRLKYVDPVADPDEDTIGAIDFNRPDNTWLKELQKIQSDFNMGLITHESVNNLTEMTQEYESMQLQQQQQSYYEPSYQQNAWQTQAQESVEQIQQPQVDAYNTQYQEQQIMWNQTQQFGDTQNLNENTYGPVDTTPLEPQPQTDYWNNTQNDEYQPPQISMPNQQKGKSIFDEDADETTNKSPRENAKNATTSKQETSAAPKQDKTANSGWFGGIWNRLALRPKNQMKLPDDKNPTIVWDPEKKRWINTEEDNGDGVSELKPPPKMSDLMMNKAAPMATNVPDNNTQTYNAPSAAPTTAPVPAPGSAPSSAPAPPAAVIPTPSAFAGVGNLQNNVQQPNLGAQQAPINNETTAKPPSGPNMFKLQSRSRSLKNSYVDVFNPGGKPTVSASTLPAPDNFGMTPISQQPMNFFIPQPVSDPNAPMNFLTPAGNNVDGSQLSNPAQ